MQEQNKLLRTWVYLIMFYAKRLQYICYALAYINSFNYYIIDMCCEMHHDYLSSPEKWGYEFTFFFYPPFYKFFFYLPLLIQSFAFQAFCIFSTQALVWTLPCYYFTYNDRIQRILEEYDGRLAEYVT